MKRCPECRRDYYDDTLSFCLDDGERLVDGPATGESATAILSVPGAVATGFQPSESPKRNQINTSDQSAIFPRGSQAEPQSGDELIERQSLSSNQAAKPHGRLGSGNGMLFGLALAVLLLVGGFLGYKYFSPTKQIESIAVMPFVNQSGNADIEYLSDGMTETLIGSLSQLPKLNVKARSSVFRYKGKEIDAETLGKELNVQAIMNGRVVQRGEELVLYVELVEAATENGLWKQTYNKTMTNLVALRNDIARDVADKLRVNYRAWMSNA